MNDSIPQKRCSKCGIEKPATTEFFNKHPDCKHGVNSRCKECEHAYCKEYSGRPERLARNREIYHTKKQDIKWLEQHKTIKHQYHQSSRYKEIDKRRNQTIERKHYLAKKQSEFRKTPKGIRARKRTQNSIARQLWNRQYQKTESAKRRSRMAASRRRAHKHDLPFNWNPDYNNTMLRYWDNCCCVCGQKATLWITIVADHWIPLSSKQLDNPGTVPTNLLPMCHAKSGGINMDCCNNSKSDKNPTQWLIERLGRRKAMEKLAEIEAYFHFVAEL